MTTLIEITVPPPVRAVFAEWANDFDALPAWAVLAMRTQGLGDPAAIAGMYRTLAAPAMQVAVEVDALRALYRQARSNRDNAPAPAMRDEGAIVCTWLGPIIAAAPG